MGTRFLGGHYFKPWLLKALDENEWIRGGWSFHRVGNWLGKTIFWVGPLLPRHLETPMGVKLSGWLRLNSYEMIWLNRRLDQNMGYPKYFVWLTGAIRSIKFVKVLMWEFERCMSRYNTSKNKKQGTHIGCVRGMIPGVIRSSSSCIHRSFWIPLVLKQLFQRFLWYSTGTKWKDAFGRQQQFLLAYNY